uniref:NADH-ubiquinone oxidoreductase chain 2 n=1 Tax=Neaxius glyptocercus TaxID=576631 RepID=K4F440_NEAGL|nr:NADH dehydrogenase subunit 2 [Neaxius glyptocercus]AEW68323.1 NADH dehydrogenase subunit 2 [Neaxius glyptocercus]
MLFVPSTLLFSTTLVGGVLLCISSDSWFGAWCGLELNLMSFIPFLVMKGNQYSSEASLKYFLIQALGSSLVLLGALEFLMISSSLYLVGFALLLKMGAAPFHFWFPQVMNGISWFQCIALITIQKVAPMILLEYLIVDSMFNFFVFWSAIMSAIVGALGGLNQTLLRKVMAFSSINHMSWMLFSILVSESAWLMYFVFYAVVSSSVIVLFSMQQLFHFVQMFNFNNLNLSLISFLSVLSMGGLPPFTGFIPKWFIIQELSSQGLLFPLFVLLASALFTLYYYLRMGIVFFVLIKPNTGWFKNVNFKFNKLSLLVMVNFLGILLPSLFMLF